MGIFSGNPKEQPMHYGEVFGIWSYLLAAKGAVSSFQTFYNHAGDEDLKKCWKKLFVEVRKKLNKLSRC